MLRFIGKGLMKNRVQHYIYVCIYVCVYMFIYIYIERKHIWQNIKIGKCGWRVHGTYLYYYNFTMSIKVFEN